MSEDGFEQLKEGLDKLAALCDTKTTADSLEYPADIELLTTAVAALTGPLVTWHPFFLTMAIAINRLIMYSFSLGLKRGKATRIIPLQFVEAENAQD